MISHSPLGMLGRGSQMSHLAGANEPKGCLMALRTNSCFWIREEGSPGPRSPVLVTGLDTGLTGKEVKQGLDRKSTRLNSSH